MIKGASFTIPVSALAALEADPEIASVTIDHPMNVMDDLTNDATGVESAWNAGYNGAGVGVAVIDSGINDSHPDLRNPNGHLARGLSPGLYGHRDDQLQRRDSMTFTVTARTWPESSPATARSRADEYAGVAPGVSLIDLRALDANGAGTDSTVIAAIQQAIALKNTYNIRVINLSLGRGIPASYTQDPLCQAVEAAWNSGIVVVVAAGNYGRLSVNGKQRLRNRHGAGQRSFRADGGRDQEQRIAPPLRLKPRPATARRGPRPTITW